MLRRLYDWVMRQAEHPRAMWILSVITFLESSLFPIPPDPLMIPLMLAKRAQAFRIAAICTAVSVAGGFLGYAIGLFLFETVGKWVFETYHLMDTFDSMKSGFDEWGAWIIIAKGMTPIPYKLLTISAGVFKFNLLTFTIASVVSRSMRFFLLAALLYYFGPPIREFIEKRLEILTLAFLVALVGGFLALKYI